ncbi:MAG: YggS family pyridoxal phosphate-dependent enzyme [Rhodobacteraceae bacterium]|nr:YggS family pyridoxal phosphate-dependent enzyme [Paracoccaceae bacterium]
MSEQTDALAQVCEQIEIAADTSGRSAGDIELIAVSKTFGADAIEPVIEAGQRVFGENRVQESLGKWPGLKAKYPDIKLHLIGPLQTNKVRDAVGLFDCIQTLDRPKLARALAKEMELQGRRLDLFVQVNTGEEAQKAGVLPADTDEFVRFCREECGLKPLGLMCIPPFDEEPSLHFALLARIAERNGLSALSMGMSSDFETAVEFGATHVRVGSAIFGARSAPPA